jgi:tetratricopeptide (TPR) repeat protein
MRSALLFVLILLAHLLLLAPFSDHMNQRPVSVKLGYIPHPQIIKVSVADHDLAVAEATVIKVLFYFGTLMDKFQEKTIIRPEYLNMYRTLLTAAQLDPYNIDNYYFAQSAFTWELGRIQEVNALLERGAQYRSWDPLLPFYIGFNYAYFLKDYTKAALYMKMAAERSGDSLYTKLAARYFYESKQTDLGMVFLEGMIAQAKDKAVKKTYTIRRDALSAILKIEDAITSFETRYDRKPADLEELLSSETLEVVPLDPYGGEFYLDENGRARSTSKLAHPGM